MTKKINHKLLFLMITIISSCSFLFDQNISNPEATNDHYQEIFFNENEYIGWWIHGEYQNIFLDENTLEEWSIHFINEEEEEIKDLYLSICEMEYFPLETKMVGYFKNDTEENDKTLLVVDFQILYIQGCEQDEE
tara:strand:+ start:3875 stop:4279 length:405 start_codon:yes stop_codon:yes gene_type:complete